MKRHIRMLTVFLVAMVALILGAAVPEGWAKEPFATTKIIFEFNSTDQDLGIQVTLDGAPWREVKIVDPDGLTIFEVEGEGSLKNFGLTELFFESNEPPLEDVPVEDIFARFPAGVYKFFGKTVEGGDLFGTATLTHNIPAGPVIVAPIEGAEVDPKNTIISWKPGESPKGIKIVGFQVVVDGGNPSRRFDVTLSAKTTSVKVPPEFLEPGTEYEFEVLAIEAGGNQTIASSSFSTK
jgi:hypothetical protein